MNKTVALAVASALGLSAFALGDVLMDQIGAYDGSNLDGSIGASQIFEESFAGYNIAAIDDFTLAEASNIDSVSFVMNGWNGYAGSAGVIEYTVNIYSSIDAAGASLTGDVFSATGSASADGGWTGSGELMSMLTDGLTLDAGTYLLSVTPRNDFSGNGQTGIMASDIGNANGYQANPNGGFGFGAYQQTGKNYAYGMNGSVVPAPGALALLGLAGLAGTRRRRG